MQRSYQHLYRTGSRSAGSIARTPELEIAGGGKTAEPQRWLKLESFAPITSRLNLDGNARGKSEKPEEQFQVIDPKDSVWNEIVKMGNTQKYTKGESGEGSGGGAAAAPSTGKVKRGGGANQATKERLRTISSMQQVGLCQCRWKT